jgi:hypothetical protein
VVVRLVVQSRIRIHWYVLGQHVPAACYLDMDGVRHRLRRPRWFFKVRSRRYPQAGSFGDILCVISTIQFVGISAFHTRISDPTIGGTYMTVRYAVSCPWPSWLTFECRRC